MMTKQELLEFEVLRYAEVPEMPAPLSEGTPVWTLAIAKVTTRTASASYAIVRNDYGRDPKVIKCFTTGGIATIDSIHPYEFLNLKVLPKFKSKEETRKFIARVYSKTLAEIEALTKEQQLRLLYEWCYREQQRLQEGLKAEAEKAQETEEALETEETEEAEDADTEASEEPETTQGAAHEAKTVSVDKDGNLE